MKRPALLLLLLADLAWAHGGAFRRPPARTPVGDTFKPVPRVTPSTAPRSVGTPLQPWEYWWRLNREPYLRIRQRMRERIVISGTRTKGIRFDRKALRDKTLLPVMLEAIRSRDEEIRTSAAVALGKFGSESARPVLLAALRRDKIKQVREAAMIGLMLLRDPKLRNELRRIARDGGEERRIRVFSVLGLGFLKDTEFLGKVVVRKGIKLDGAGSTVDEMRAGAALALGFAGSGGAAASLVGVAMDREAQQATRGFAGSGLARLRNVMVEPELLRLVADKGANHLARYGAAIALGGIVPSTRTNVIDRLGRRASRDRDRRLRALLLMSLGRIGGDRAAAHIVGAERSFIKNRGFLYLALGISRAEGSGDVLMSMFKKLRNANERGACALGLALAGHKRAAGLLREQVKRGNPAFLPHGMVALGILDDPKAIPLVQAVLKKNRDPLVRREGALALALLRRAAAIPELVALMHRSKSLYIRGAVAAALGLVGDLRAVDPLLKIYRDKTLRGEERAIALVALGRIGDLEEIPLLARLAFDLNPYVDSDAVSEALTIL